jgi:hypothetical protein
VLRRLRLIRNLSSPSWNLLLLTNWSLADLVLVNNFLELLRPVHLVVLLKNPWLEILIMLIHDSGLSEVPFELLQALNPAIGNLATFLGVEHRPLAAMELAMEI